MRHCGVAGRAWGNDVVDLVFLKVGLCVTMDGAMCGHDHLVLLCEALLGRECWDVVTWGTLRSSGAECGLK